MFIEKGAEVYRKAGGFARIATILDEVSRKSWSCFST